MKLGLATATHNFKCAKITDQCLFNLKPNIGKFSCLKSHIIPNNSDLEEERLIMHFTTPLTDFPLIKLPSETDFFSKEDPWGNPWAQYVL